jgi:hypothetical protein
MIPMLKFGRMKSDGQSQPHLPGEHKTLLVLYEDRKKSNFKLTMSY